MKAPAFQFYPRDWLTESGLRAVPLAARGLWIELLCHMHFSPRRGFLLHANGEPVAESDIARLVGDRPENVRRYLSALATCGVFSRDEQTGAIVSRRMVRDERISAARRAAGSRGGNPALVNRLDKQNGSFAYPNCEQSPTPASASASAITNKQTSPIGDDAFVLEANTEQAPSRHRGWKARAFDAFWLVVWAKIGRDAARKAFERKATSQGIADRIIAAAKRDGPRLLREAQAQGRGVLHPATWINQGRYDDEPVNFGAADDPGPGLPEWRTGDEH